MNASEFTSESYFDANDTLATVKTTEVDLVINGDDIAEYLDYLATVSTRISYFTVPLLAVIGMVGNAMTLAIMRSKHFRSSTISIYLAALAISDSLYILLSPFTKSFINDLFHQDPKATSQVGCKLFFLLFRSAKICSSWFVVVMCIERFVVVWLPLKAKRLSRKKTATISVMLVVLCIGTFNGFWTMTTSVVGGVCIPNAVTESSEDLAAAFVVAGTCIFNIIPTCVLILFTPLTILQLYRQMSLRQTMSSVARNEDAFRVTRMLLAVSVAYILLVTPISVAHSVAFFNGDSIFVSKDPDFVIFREFAQTFEQLNYSVNFFLYLACNKSFRTQFCRLLGHGHSENLSNEQVPRSRNYKGSLSSDSTNVNPSLD